MQNRRDREEKNESESERWKQDRDSRYSLDGEKSSVFYVVVIYIFIF